MTKEISASVQAGYSQTTTSSDSLTETTSITKATIQTGVSLTNVGDRVFDLRTLAVSLIWLDWEEQEQNLGTYSFKTISGGEATLAKGESISDTASFVIGDPDIVKQIAADPTRLYLRVASIDYTDQSGIDYAYIQERVLKNTIQVAIDYGDGNTLEELVSVTPFGKVTAPQAIQPILGLNYEVDAEGKLLSLTSPNNQNYTTENGRVWTVIHEDEVYNGRFDQINLTATDQLYLIYEIDEDGDGVSLTLEQVYETLDTDSDTDDDGIDDATEAFDGWSVTLINSPSGNSSVTYEIASVPNVADVDQDGLNDSQEKEAKTDPFLQDTDGDGKTDSEELNEGTNPLNPFDQIEPNTEYIYVNTLNDVVSNSDGLTSLREAIAQVEQSSEQSVITFDLLNNTDKGLSIELDPNLGPLTYQGDKDLQIVGLSINSYNSDGTVSLKQISINGQDQTAIFQLSSTGTVSISNLDLVNGKGVNGGAISLIPADLDNLQTSDLKLTNVNFRNNQAKQGGAIYSQAVATSASNWSNAIYEISNSYFTDFLGRFGGGEQVTSKKLTLDGQAATVEFMFYRIDSWDTEYFKVYIDGTTIINRAFSGGQNYTSTITGNTNNISWSITPQNDYGNRGFGSWNDQSFKVSLQIPTGYANINLGFGSNLNSGLDDESFGIDNLKVITATGTVLEDFQDYKNIVASSFSDPSDVVAADFDKDGDIDIAAITTGYDDDDLVVWYNNGNGNSWTSKKLDDSAKGDNLASSIYATDLNLDGSIDLISATNSDDNVIVWNNYGQSWSPTTLKGNLEGASGVVAADLESSNNYPDVIATSEDDDNLWIRLQQGNNQWDDEEYVPDGSVDESLEVFALDLQGTGKVDVIVGARDKDDDLRIAQNQDGTGRTWTMLTIDTDVSATAIHGGDLDGDGDNDIIIYDEKTQKTYWYKNNGNYFFQRQTISNLSGDQIADLYVVDMDNDGVQDIVVGGENEISWLRNSQGNGTAWETYRLNSDFGNVRAVFPADIDEDGFSDVVAVSTTTDQVAWFKNPLTVWSTQPNLELTNVKFNGNRAETNGGAVYSQGGVVEVTNSTFEDNQATAGDGGALALYNNTTLTLENNNFAQNRSGGGNDDVGDDVYVYSPQAWTFNNQGTPDVVFEPQVFYPEGANSQNSYIADATVFRDLDGDQQLDDNESSTTTNERGFFNYLLLGKEPEGTLVSYGGTRVIDGTPNLLRFSAPSDARVISPLTTLICFMKLRQTQTVCCSILASPA